MANPSLKNGFLSIANELVEQLAKINIPGNEMRIIWVVWRKTWGWQEGNRKKDWDWISLSQFEKLTGMKHSTCVREIKSLVVKRLLLKSENQYKFNQNYNEWIVAKRLPPVAKRLQGSSQKATKTSSQKATNKRNKETNTKENISAPKVADTPIKNKKQKYLDKTPFTLKEFVESMRGSPQPHIKILAEYADTKKPNFTTKGQWYAFFDRNVRAARDLSPYDEDQIAKAFDKLVKDIKTPNNPKGFITKWGLETLSKYLE